jgi:hypothetical protein
MLVRGSYVGEMICQQRTRMAGNQLRREELIGPRSLWAGEQVESNNGSKKDGCGQT